MELIYEDEELDMQARWAAQRGHGHLLDGEKINFSLLIVCF